MTRTLRRVHLIAWIGIAAGLPPAIWIAAAGRRDVPSTRLPPFLDSRACEHALSTTVAWEGVQLDTRVCPGADASAPWTIELRPLEPIAEPDLLLYWADRENGRADAGAQAAVPPGARLLGPVDGAEGARLPLPTGAGAGRLVLVSHAYGLRLGSAMISAPGVAQ